MSPKIDMIGKKVGMLTVLRESSQSDPSGRALWDCQCECGKIKTYAGQNLRTGRIVSCGHHRAEQARQRFFKDLTGQQFGRLTVVKESGYRGSGKYEAIFWECKCACGTYCIRRGDSLLSSVKRSGTPSCGCFLKGLSIKDLTGQVFGRLTVLSFLETRDEIAWWQCKCDCGKLTQVRGFCLTRGTTSSCGCFKRDATASRMTTHGMTNTKEWRAWRNAIQRCHNPKTKRYSGWGGRGILVCDRWRQSFENFYADMGPCPSPRHSLDRIDNDGPYSPENCRWALPEDQIKNRGEAIWVDYNGERVTLFELSRLAKIPYVEMVKRYFQGESLCDIMNS